ncbi:MAG: aminotransferase class III-fold pyridoxal phosphate-dependent enzyme [Sphingopyxis sp.]|uniref:aminotransferase class III-fold pyridoxal phosphate-dependent enzyme n=1 Tax=Sphingopyxis sp. TaxID=1908224 RepID=UPI003D811EC6
MSPSDYAARTGFDREPPFAIAAAEGSFVQDREGQHYLDLTSGWNVVNAGWNNPEIWQAALEAGLRNPFRPSWCDDDRFDALTQRIAAIAPGRRIIPSCSGNEAVDNALKLARLVTGRAGVICIEGAYHGSGTGASLATGYHVPHLEALDLQGLRLTLPRPSQPGALEQAESAIRAFEPGGAIVFETVRTNMACEAVPQAFRDMLRRVASELGLVLICDEIGTGINRLGSPFSSLDGDGAAAPDIILTAKALTNGLYPLSLCLVRERLMRHVDMSYFSSTYGGMPAGCAAAVATLDYHAEHTLGARAIAGGQALAAGIEQHVLDIDGVRSLEGAGLERALHLDWMALGRRGLSPFQMLAKLRDQRVFATLSPGEDHLMLLPPLTTPHEALVDAAVAIGKVLRN